MSTPLDRLFTELAQRLRGQPRVPESAARLIEGCRDALIVTPETPEHRRTESWHDGHALGKRFREELGDA